MFGTTVLAGLCLLIVVSLASGASFVEVVFSIAMKVASVAAAAAAILISGEGVVMGGYSLLIRRAAERGRDKGRDEGRIEERRRMERWREEQVKAGFDIPPLPDADGNSPATPSKRDT